MSSTRELIQQEREKQSRKFKKLMHPDKPKVMVVPPQLPAEKKRTGRASKK